MSFIRRNIEIEIATGSHPYSKWKTPFEQLKQVVHEPPPRLASGLGYSEVFQDFVALWLVYFLNHSWNVPHFSHVFKFLLLCLVFSFSLTKDYNLRPKYPDLLAHNFLQKAAEDTDFDMGAFITDMLRKVESEQTAALPSVTAKALPKIS